jgi:hypothetical protein
MFKSAPDYTSNFVTPSFSSSIQEETSADTFPLFTLFSGKPD